MMIYAKLIKIGPVIMKGVHKLSKYYSVLHWVMKLALWFSRKKDKNVKGWQTDRPTDRWYTTGHRKRSAGEWIMYILLLLSS